MAKQRMVKDSFWTDPYIEDLDPSEKLLFIYLLTNPLVNVLGIYEIRHKRIAYETGIDKDMVDKIFQRFVKDEKLITVDDYVILINFTKNQSDNPSMVKGMQRVLDSLPPACIQAVTASPQLLTYFTSLNLTLLNSTLPIGGSEAEEKISSPTPKEHHIVSEIKKISQDLKDSLVKNGFTEEVITEELNAFYLYWTEKSPNGKKQRWQKEKVFDVKRRLVTWFRNSKKFSKDKNGNKYNFSIDL